MLFGSHSPIIEKSITFVPVNQYWLALFINSNNMLKLIFTLRFYRFNSVGQIVCTGEFVVHTFRSLLQTFKLQSVHHHCYRLVIDEDLPTPFRLFSSEICKVRSVANFKRVYIYSKKRAMVCYFESI